MPSQTFDGDALPISGATDDYRRRANEVSTSSMAEGFIEGSAKDYQMKELCSTDFRYSRFDAISAPPRDVAAMLRVLEAPVADRMRHLPVNATGGQRLLKNTNLQGGDLWGVAAPSSAACRAACERVGRCVAFTFILDSSSRRRCWLKQRGYRVLESRGTVSGLK